jgi:proline iminopeptidase
MPFPPIEPYEHGMLDTGDGNFVYWETCGDPDGKPALVVHGGPGSGCSVGNRRAFDPERYRIILFDQRGCGRSKPHASDPATDMSTNTTEHLLRDMEQLREHLGVEKWLLFGSSWGVTLALAYAERRPERVTEMVMSSVTTSTRADIDWLYNGVARFFPEAHERFRAIQRDVGRLAGIPAVLIHGRNDLGGPVAVAWNLAQAWPQAELFVVDDSGHTGSKTMQAHLDAAIAKFAMT